MRVTLHVATASKLRLVLCIYFLSSGDAYTPIRIGSRGGRDSMSPPPARNTKSCRDSAYRLDGGVKLKALRCRPLSYAKNINRTRARYHESPHTAEHITEHAHRQEMEMVCTPPTMNHSKSSSEIVRHLAASSSKIDGSCKAGADWCLAQHTPVDALQRAAVWTT